MRTILLILVASGVVSCGPREPVVLGDPGRDAGRATTAISQPTWLQGYRLRPVEVLEDSRCPADVQCVHAGFFRARVEIRGPLGEREEVMELGRAITLDDAQALSICQVTPERLRNGALPSRRTYRVTFCTGPGD